MLILHILLCFGRWGKTRRHMLQQIGIQLYVYQLMRCINSLQSQYFALCLCAWIKILSELPTLPFKKLVIGNFSFYGPQLMLP